MGGGRRLRRLRRLEQLRAHVPRPSHASARVIRLLNHRSTAASSARCNHSSRYYRCRIDKSGCEPKRLFTLAEFMIYDKDGSGTVNEDECMEMM